MFCEEAGAVRGLDELDVELGTSLATDRQDLELRAGSVAKANSNAVSNSPLARVRGGRPSTLLQIHRWMSLDLRM